MKRLPNNDWLEQYKEKIGQKKILKDLSGVMSVVWKKERQRALFGYFVSR